MATKNEPNVSDQAEEKPGAIDLSTVNRFKFLTAPCLVCGKMPPGMAFGITPDQAVCAADYTDNPDETQAALEAAARGEKPKRKPARKAGG
jgi:hypothetical protein